MSDATPGFWETKTLDQMSAAEWESLCDGCARCCMIKLQDEDTEQIIHTSAVCHLLDQQACRCTAYPQRHERVPDCIAFSAAIVQELEWLPRSCAYRRIAEGRGLADWHPLVSGDPESVHAAGVSVRGKVVSEATVDDQDLEDMVVHWVEC
ncbi:MAG: YcgN family cysteine cluster protein [Pseudomonadales bacterium]